MRVTTLKASTAGLSQLLDYYAGLAEDRELSGSGRGPVDYYLDPDEPPGRWAGTGRHVLGLGGTVPGGQLRALLEGEQPGTSRQLGRRFGDSSARGFDATFSAPKSVSVLWALTPDPWVRAEVLAAHDTAVDAALEWFEHHGAVTRRGTDGVHQVDTRGITAAVFRQHTSRTVDPQLHTHAVISAKVQDPTGRWLSLDARFLKYQQRTIGWIYDAALRTELAQRLGATWSVRDCGVWDLDCIPDHEHPDRGTAHLRADYVAEHVELGWAVTGYGNQGDTVDIGIAILEPTSSRNHTYVALTRGRHANHAILPDPTGTADPTEQLAQLVARPTSAESALAVRGRLEKRAGLRHGTAAGSRLALAERGTEPSLDAADRLAVGVEGPSVWNRLDHLERRRAGEDRGTSVRL